MSEENNRGELYAAIARAMGRVKPVGHDAENSYHRYKYTSAEAVIAECGPALAAEQVALIPEAFIHEPAGEGRWKVETSWLLAHPSGGELRLHRTMVAQEERGRPADKALFVANTTLYAYLLRDLLALARPDSTDDVAGRDDTKYEPQKRAATKASPKKTAQKPQKAPSKPRNAGGGDDMEEKALAAIHAAESFERLHAVRQRVTQTIKDETVAARLLAAVDQRHRELGAERDKSSGLKAGRHRAGS